MNRALRVGWPALSIVVALAALFAALAIGGGAGGDDALTSYGLPVAQLLVNLAASAVLGTLVLAVVALHPGEPRWSRLLDVVAACSAVWAAAAAAVGFVGFLVSAEGTSMDDPRFGPEFVQFISAIPQGQAWLATTVAAALVTVLAIAVRSHTGVALLTVAAAVALVPMALQGHAASSPGDHGNAIVAFGLHIVGAAVWVGGLGALLVLGRSMRGQALKDLVSRYSTIALVCFVVVAVSGVLSAAIRLIDLSNLVTPYGVLVLVKTAALLAAGVLGAIYRGVLIPRIAGGPGRRPFFLVVAGELVILGVASGFAAGLAFSAPPDGRFVTPTTPAEILTGSALPAPMSLASVLGGWHLDVLWIMICAFLAVLYPLGVLRLRRRGDGWPVGRTISWLAGVVVLFWLTNGGLAVYQDVLFSAHMLVHMALTMLVPLLLVPAAPVTLALRAVRKRQDGTRGAREWLLITVHSRVAGVLTNPIVAAVLFAGSLIAFYYSPLFRWATTDHLGHEWMTAHFLVTGYLFVQSMVGADPVPFRLPYPLRLLVLLATMAFHAFFGLALILSSGLLLADWYGAMGWGTSALADQHAGGGIAWSVGEIPTLVLAVVVAIAWSRSDERESRRSDRRELRTGDADLGAYNAMLARLQRERA